jgi:hypothetical protein
MMTATGQRIADLEQQLAGLAERFAKLEHQAFLVKTLEDIRLARASYDIGRVPAKASRPRHLHAVDGAVR